jgi:glutathione synthase/RimK-type ligase-like ATP-grasp enzyme
VLAGEPLYACKYTIPRKQWKIMTYTANGRTVYGTVKGVPLQQTDSSLLDTALAAAGAVGRGLYGVDLKQTAGGYAVIEVNDNPTILAGDEDQKAGDLYERLVLYLVGERKEP